MKSLVRWLGSAIGVVLLASGAFAQPTGQDATVKTPTAEVRGNRSELFPITTVLRQGQPIRILREEDGYYAITPPAGSSSWIEDRALKHTDTPRPGKVTSALVLIDDASVRLGGERSNGPLQFETVKLKRGTIVRVLGDKAFAEGKEWWRIQPPPAEVRYVLKDVINQPTSTVVSASPVSAGAPNSSGKPTHPLWVQAESAYQARDYGRADLLFRQLAGEMAQPGGDHDLAIRCYNRIEQLSRANPATWPARTQAPGMLVSSARPPAASNGSNPNSPTPIGTVATGPGWLRRSSVQIDGRTAYVLEDNRGQPKYYALPNSGLNMEPYLNRPVELFGLQMQRADVVGGGYLAVSRLQLLR